MTEVIERLRQFMPNFWAPLLISARRPRTIRFRILSLISLIAIPLILLFAWSTIRVAGLSRHVLELQRADVTNGVSTAIDRDISHIIGMLTGLATAGGLQTGDTANFSAKAALLAKQPFITHVWAFDESGTVVSGTSPAASDPVRVTAVARDIFSQGDVVVSGVEGEGPDSAAVIIATPVRRWNRIVYGVAARFRIAQLSNVFADKSMESQWVAAVVDRDGRFVARSLAAADWLGKMARPELGQAARDQSTVGLFENVTHEGVAMFNAYRRSPLTDWTTVVAVPRDEIHGPIRRVLAILALAGLTILAGTLYLSSLLAARIAGPVRDLSQYATSLATGQPYAPFPHHILELEEVRNALEKAMAQSARLSALVASSGDAILSVDLDGTIRSWNSGAEALFGFTEEEIIGRSKTAIVPEDRLEEFNELSEQVLAGGGIRVDTERRRKDGARVDVSLEMAPIRDAGGKVFAISSIIHDISDRKAAEAHQTFLMRELAHRSKNQLAIIQAIAKQTARRTTSIETFLATFGKRIQGLSASHDLLAAQNWTSVPLSDLIESQLSVFVKWPNDRVTADGPGIMLSPASAEALGLALHELATNSAKYGALSVERGRLVITWTKTSRADGSYNFTIDWREHDGPPVTAPEEKGFGSQIIEKMAAQSVKGSAHIAYLPAGVHWRLECPFANISAKT